MRIIVESQLFLLPAGVALVRFTNDGGRPLALGVFVVLAWLWAFVLIRALRTRVFVTTRTISRRDTHPGRFWIRWGAALLLYAGCVAGVGMVPA